jgi:death-on-curing protein
LKEPVFLGLAEVIELHHDQMKRYGGPNGIRDIDLLKSAIAMPPVSFGGEYLFHIVRNHPFIDGNKRTGAVASVVFLIMNGLELTADEDSFEKLVRSVAEGKTHKTAIAKFFKTNTSVTG